MNIIMLTIYWHFPHLSHQDLHSTLGIDYTCEPIYALFQTPLAVSNENFLLEVSYLGVSVNRQITVQVWLI